MLTSQRKVPYTNTAGESVQNPNYVNLSFVNITPYYDKFEFTTPPDVVPQ